MKPHWLLYVFLFLQFSSESIHAQNSPLSCKVTYFGAGSLTPELKSVNTIECDVTDQDLIIKELIANRGNCLSGNDTLWSMNSAHWSLRRESYFNKPLKFGDHIVIFTACQNLLEYTIETNKGNWTWRLR